MSKRKAGKDYEVGYGKPSVAHRFQKGTSGNPKGRPKEAKGLKASLAREMQTLITVKDGGKPIRISKAEAAAKVLANKALAGDVKSIAMLVGLDVGDLQEGGAGASGAPSSAPLTEEEVKMLRSIFGEHRSYVDLSRTGDSDGQGEDK